MVKNYIENIRDLVSQAKSGEFTGFSVDVEDDRDFDEVVSQGRVDSINLYDGIPDKWVNSLRIDSFLEGQKVGIFAEGKKLTETTITESDLRFGGSSESFSFKIPDRWKDATDIAEAFPDLRSKFPDEVHTIRDLARVMGFQDGGTISFKAIKETQPSSNNKSVGTQSSNMIENVMQTVKENKMILAGAGIVAILVIE
mgnify:CR=1 FL=1